jgi:hypothetical protein
MPVGLVVDIKGDASNLDAALGKSEGNVKGFGGVLGSVGPKALLAAGGVTIAAAAVLELTSAAAADRDEQNKLEQAIKASGAAHGNWTEQVEAAITAGQDKAFTDSETRAALEPLTAATGDMAKSTELLALAQDVARLSGVDLATAADAVAKAQAGQDGALRKLVPGMQKGATVADTMANATKLAAGQADLYAESSAGMGARAADAFGEIGETIGSAFLPVLDAILPALLPVLKNLGELVKSILPLIIPLIKTLATVLGFVAGALSTVVGWLVKLVQWLATAMRKVGEFLSSLNPFRNIQLPSLPFLSSAGAPAGVGAARGARGARATAAPAVTINIQGDPAIIEATIIRVLRSYGRRNAFTTPAVTTGAV